MLEFTTKDGTTLVGKLVDAYVAFEGDTRYIFDVNGRQYRCVKVDGKYIEYVA
jgi:mRNA-degrading endonuclease HigB of HigAB toxin-antitoxin module